MASLKIKLFEIHDELSDQATLTIQCDADDRAVTLYVNDGDEFEFDADELLRALNAVFMFRKSKIDD